MTQEQPLPATATATVLPTGSVFAGMRSAITGLVPPETAEARIRVAWPAVSAYMPPLAQLGKRLILSIVLAPIGWLVLAPLFAFRIAPFVCRRYTLTNRRIMIGRGMKPDPIEEVALSDIEDVRLPPESYDSFFRAGDIEVIVGGQVRMKLVAVNEPESFRRAIINAYTAWVPDKSKSLGFLAASAKI